MRNRLTLLVFLTIFLSFSLSLYAQELMEGRCLNVLDGDTIEVDFNKDGIIQEDSERVEVLGIDCYEPDEDQGLAERTEQVKIMIKEEKKLSLEAKEYGRKALLNQTIKVEAYGGGRPGSVSHGYVYIGVTDYGASLLKKGLAKVNRRNKKHPKYEEYLKLEK